MGGRPPGITRRRAIAGTAALASAASLGAWWGLVPAPGARILSTVELSVVQALAITMFPGDPFPLDGLEAGVPAEVDRLLRDLLTPIHATGFRGLLHTLEWGTVASRGTRFSRLAAAERAEVLGAWADPQIVGRRVAMDSLKAILGMAYFGHPEILAHTGWRRTCGGGPS